MNEHIDAMPEITLMPDEKLRDDLRKKGILMVSDKVGDHESNEAVSLFKHAASLQPDKVSPIYILIDSGGGDAMAGWRMFNAIRNYPGPTVGMVLGRANSAAMLILQACDYRFALMGTTGLIHSTKTTFSIGAYNQDEAEHIIATAAQRTEIYLRVISQRTGLGYEKLVELAKLDVAFLFTPESEFIDDVVELAAPIHPLPKKWHDKIYGASEGSKKFKWPDA